MVDVFISYSKSDRARVAQLARAIEDEGYEVWWDAELPLHQSYGDVITEKIAHAKAAIVVWSPDAAASEWVRAEADTARNHKKLIQTALGDIIPPMPFNQVQCANIEHWNGEADHEGWRKVRQSLVALCGPRENKSDAAAAAVAAAPPPPPERDMTRPAATAAVAAAAGSTSAGAMPLASQIPPQPYPRTERSGPLAKAGPAAIPILAVVGLLVLGLGGYALFGGGDDEDAQTLIGGNPVIADDGSADGTSDPAVVPGKPGEDTAASAPVEAAPPAPVQGGDQLNREVNLVNGSGETIFYVFWSTTEDSEWGQDRLGDDVLMAGQSWQVTADNGSGSCNYDFMAQTESGRQIVRNNVDVCSVYNIDFN